MDKDFIDLGIKSECCGGSDKYYPHLDVKGIDIEKLSGDTDEEVYAKVILKKKSYSFEDKECCFEVCGIKFDKVKVAEKSTRENAEEMFDSALEEQY